MKRFLTRLYEAVVSNVRLDVVKCLLIAGPGFTKDAFRQFLLDEAQRVGNKELLAFKQSIATAPTSTAYLQGVDVRFKPI
jgi:protein pelota